MWFHSGPAASGTPDGAELVIWMRSRGGIRPGGSKVAENVEVAVEAGFNLWRGGAGNAIESFSVSVGNQTP